MADTLEKSENDKISGLSDILSVDTLSLDAQSFKTVSTKNILDIDIIFTSAEEKPSYDKKLKKFFISIVDKITNPSDLIKEVKNDIKKWKSKDKKRKSKNRLNDFLGYYECLNTSELLNPKISLFTARIDLHRENVDEAKNLIITKIKNTPYVENASIFVIPGVGNHMNSTNNPGVLNKSFPVWIKDDSIKNLIDGEPVKGEGTYEIFIKKINNNNNNNNNSNVIIENETINEWKEYAENGDIKYMMALAGYYMMKGPKENHREAESWYKEAEKLGSYEAKLCLGYMYSIGKLSFDPKRAKVLFKDVVNLEKSNNDSEKELSRIAMRNMALIYHNSHLIRAFEPSNLTKVRKRSDLIISNLAKIKLKRAFKWYKKSFDLYDSQSAYNLGLLYESDDGIKKDEKQAEYYFRKAVEFDNNNIFAKKKLGNILFKKKDANEKDEGLRLLMEVASIGLE